MPWVSLRVADDASAVADVMRAFSEACETEGRPPATALFSRTEQDGAVTFYMMGFGALAVAAVVERFGFQRCAPPRPEGVRLLIGHPIAARVLARDVKRSRSWWAEARAGKGEPEGG